MDPFDPDDFVRRLHALFARNDATGEVERQPALAKALADMLHKLTDPELLAAYQRTSGEPGDPEADALLAEIERRGLDI